MTSYPCQKAILSHFSYSKSTELFKKAPSIRPVYHSVPKVYSSVRLAMSGTDWLGVFIDNISYMFAKGTVVFRENDQSKSYKTSMSRDEFQRSLINSYFKAEGTIIKNLDIWILFDCSNSEMMSFFPSTRILSVTFRTKTMNRQIPLYFDPQECLKTSTKLELKKSEYTFDPHQNRDRKLLTLVKREYTTKVEETESKFDKFISDIRKVSEDEQDYFSSQSVCIDMDDDVVMGRIKESFPNCKSGIIRKDDLEIPCVTFPILFDSEIVICKIGGYYHAIVMQKEEDVDKPIFERDVQQESRINFDKMWDEISEQIESMKRAPQ